MPNAIAIVAHHDDHVLWMGGTIQRLAAAGWRWTLVAMCVPDAAKREYFNRCCAAFGATSLAMDFQDYQGGAPFSRNTREEMKTRLEPVVRDESFDLVFTHSRSENGEYWALHANHVEVREVIAELVDGKQLGAGR